VASRQASQELGGDPSTVEVVEARTERDDDEQAQAIIRSGRAVAVVGPCPPR
jgi:hypothetical protein